jgi:hypothetical protein
LPEEIEERTGECPREHSHRRGLLSKTEAAVPRRGVPAGQSSECEEDVTEHSERAGEAAREGTSNDGFGARRNGGTFCPPTAEWVERAGEGGSCAAGSVWRKGGASAPISPPALILLCRWCLCLSERPEILERAGDIARLWVLLLLLLLLPELA